MTLALAHALGRPLAHPPAEILHRLLESQGAKWLRLVLRAERLTADKLNRLRSSSFMLVWSDVCCNESSIFSNIHESFDWRIRLSIGMIDGHFTFRYRISKTGLRYAHGLKSWIRRPLFTATIFLKLRVMRESKHEIGLLVVRHIFMIVQVSQILMLLVDVGSLLQPLKLSLESLSLLLLGISAIDIEVSLFNELLEL